MNIKTTLLTLALTGTVVTLPLGAVFAQSTTPSAKTTRQQERQDARLQTLKQKGDDEITKRITSLNQVISKINAMKHVSQDQKNTLDTTIQNDINALTTLKAKIDADTDLTTLQQDVKSIFGDYRIYALVIPQTHELAAADAMLDVVSLMKDVETKLQTRITDAKNKGKDVTALQNALNDMQAKVNDAATQAQNAINTVISLVPDKGDKTVFESNKAALQKARDMLKTGEQDLKTARSDAKTIIDGLKAFHTSPSPSPTA